MVRRDLHENWIEQNPILMSGEIIYVIDKNKLKIGNGKDKYNDLPFVDGNFYIDEMFVTKGGMVGLKSKEDINEFVNLLVDRSIGANYDEKIEQIKRIFPNYHFNEQIDYLEDNGEIDKYIKTCTITLEHPINKIILKFDVEFDTIEKGKFEIKKFKK